MKPSQKTRLVLRLMSLILFIVTVASTARAQFYEVIDLGVGPAGTNSYGLSVNNSGQVVGESIHLDRDGRVVHRGFLWLPTPALGLPSGLNELGGPDTKCRKINDLGQFVGGMTDSTGRQTGFLWLPSPAFGLPAGLNNLGTMGGVASDLFSISPLGKLAGYITLVSRELQWLVWDNGTFTTYSPGGHEGAAVDIDDLGVAAGWIKDATGHHKGVVFKYGASLTVGDLGLGTGVGMAGIDEPAEMYLAFDSNMYYNPCIWLSGPFFGRTAGLHDLGRITGWAQNRILSCAPGGMVMVGLADTDTVKDEFDYERSSHAYQWNAGGFANIDLNTLIPPDSGWVLQAAHSVSKSGFVTGWGTHNGVTRGYLLVPNHLNKLSTGTNICGGKPCTGKIELSRPAPKGGLYVKVSTSNPACTVPDSVFVPEGATSKTFTIKTTPVGAITTGVVRVQLGLETKSATIKIRPIGVKSVSLILDSVIGGEAVSGYVLLEAAAAPSFISVTITSSNPLIAVPSNTTITVPQGSALGQFTINTLPVSDVVTVTVKATANGISKSDTLSIYP